MCGTALDNLIGSWRSVRFEPGRRNTLPLDDRALTGLPTVERKSWDEYCVRPECEPTALHTHLMPMPWVGNLRTAKVFLLALNPGFGPHDYFGEHRVPEYLEMLKANLRQDDGHIFPFLGPEHSWHGGGRYWPPKLKPILDGVGDPKKCARGIAVLELVPYHSAQFGLSQRIVNQLESVRLMRAFVREDLIPRASAGRCKIITLRGHASWGIPELPMPHYPLAARIAPSDSEGAINILAR